MESKSTVTVTVRKATLADLPQLSKLLQQLEGGNIDTSATKDVVLYGSQCGRFGQVNLSHAM
jgi:hypothetical protein